MSKTAAIYARVSSDQQKEQNTIASQTAALKEYAQAHDYTVPEQWIFEDEGYSGSVLTRPALERLRDCIAEGEIETVLIYAPDRLSRNYAYQVLLLEEFGRHGAEVLFLKAPPDDTPEQRLMLQFQGMMAEYERAQIVERCRRGKRHQAKAGNVNVLSVAPYAYRYIKKTEAARAYFEVVESEAEVVRKIFALFVQERRSIRAIVRELNAQQIPTRWKKTWLHSTIWGILHNPAYYGRAGYGKKERVAVRHRNKTSRQKGRPAVGAERMRKRSVSDWIEIPVPAIVSKEMFDLAQERLELNKKLSARHTKVPSVLQGLLVCAGCGYAMCLSGKARSGGRRYRYYRCLGSDHRRDKVPSCNFRPIRVEYLDEFVWGQVWQMLNHPQLVQEEIARRVCEPQQSSPVEQRQEQLSKEIARLQLQTDKLIDAYQEQLIDLAELRRRVPELRRRQMALEKELENLKLKAVEHSRLREMNHSMEQFMEQLRNSAQTLDVPTKQQIVRLLLREVVVGADTITLHHSIPLFRDAAGQKLPSYRLCTRRDSAKIIDFIDPN